MAAACGALALAMATDRLGAQPADGWPFQPSLQGAPASARFEPPPQRPERQAAPTRRNSGGEPLTIPRSTGGTGFDATGSITPARPPGTAHVGGRRLQPPAAVAMRPPQAAARAAYAEAYRSPSVAQTRRRPVSTEDPFEPVGVRAGALLLRPSVEVSRGYDSNPARVPQGEGSWFTLVSPELLAQSQWSSHEWGASLRGSYVAYDRQASLNRPTADGRLYARIDVSRDTRLDLEGRLGVRSEYPGSPNVPAGLDRLPIYTGVGGSAAIVQRYNRLELTAQAGADVFTYGDSKLSDGTTSSNRDRNYTQYLGRLRAGYEFVPGVRPFIEVAADRRVHEQEFDRTGTQRDSHAIIPRVGSTFELTRSLTGEASVGYIERRFRDDTLAPLRGIVADASLLWSASGLTKLRLNAASRAEDSVLAGVSGALRREASIEVEHAFRRWLIGSLRFGYGLDTYVGLGRDDTRTSLGAAITYKLNPNLHAKAEVRREWLNSNVPGVAYDASIFMLGVKLQR